MKNILVVDDDLNLNQIVCTFLNDNGYSTQGCLSPFKAYTLMENMSFDAIITDIMMPDIDGFEFAKTVRSSDKTIPILFVSARDDLDPKYKGFCSGLEDYMVKPIQMDELIRRIEALLYRAQAENQKELAVGSLILHKDNKHVTVDNREIPVTEHEFNVLYKLLSIPKRTFSRSQLKDECLGTGDGVSLGDVDALISRLRDKFSGCKDFSIMNTFGLGYKAVLQ